MNSHRLPFPESGLFNPSSGSSNSASSSIASGSLLNSIRPETANKHDIKKNTETPTLPSLNEVMKPMFENNEPMYSMGSPLMQPFSHQKGNQLPPPTNQSQQRTPPKTMPPLMSLLNPMQQSPTPQQTHPSKQNLYLLNERNQIEFERQNAMAGNLPHTMHPPTLPTPVNPSLQPLHPPMGMPTGSNLPPSLMSALNPADKARMENRGYQEQLQQAKRLGENMQSNIRSFSTSPSIPSSSEVKKRKSESVSAPYPSSNPQQYQDAQGMLPIGGDGRSAFSPLKKRETSPIITTSTSSSSVPMSTTTPPLPSTPTISNRNSAEESSSDVNSVCWAPHEFGLSLACASSDCSISILTYKADNTWDVQKINQAHAIGVNSVSWAPAVSPGSLISSSAPSAPPAKRLVSGGCDNLVKLWRFSETENVWKHEETLEQQHTDWVRDVAWAPNIGLPSSTIATCSQDGTVVIWTQDPTSSAWSRKLLPKFPDVVWRVSWSITGNILAVAGGDNKVTLWKESLDGEWKCVSALTEEGETSPQ